jgi:xylulokinase
MTDCFIGFDCGTMGTKVALYTIDGECLATFYKEIETFKPNVGWVEMNAIDFFNNVVEGIRAVLADSGVPGSDVKAISASGIVDGTVPVDDDLNPVGPFIPYLDMRAQKEAKEVNDTMEPIWVEESAKWGVGPDCVPMVMRWLYQNKVPYVEKAKKFLNIAPFVLSRLAGLKAKDAYVDWAHASGWLIGFDLKNDAWSERQFKMYGVPMDILPKIVSPFEVIGQVDAAGAELTGLAVGTAVVAGAGDLMASTLGAGLTEAGQAFDVSGTASIMTFILEDFQAAVNNKVLVTSKYVWSEQLCLWGCTSSGGYSLGWFRDNVLGTPGAPGVYKMMDELAAQTPPGAAAGLFLPYLTGTMTPSWPNAKAAYLGLTPSHDRGYMWRAMLEGVASEYRLFLNSLEEQGITYSRVYGVGGGSRSPLWNQIKADMLHTPYYLITTQDTGALGNCLIAAHGAGYIADVKATAKSWSQETDHFDPRPEYVDFYNRFWEARQKIVDGPITEMFNLWAELEAVTPPAA